MSITTRTRLDVVPLSTHIGAEIRGLDLRDKPDDETIRAIYQAWLDHLVIVFPEQKLSQEDFIRATGFFGAVFDHAEKREFVYEHVWRVGDLLLWDNRCSSHARTDFPTTERRLMLRTTVKGTVRPY